MKNFLCYVLFISFVLASVSAGGTKEKEAASQGNPASYDFEVISEVMEASSRVTAVVIDFKTELPINWNLKNAFQVNAELKPVKPLQGGDVIANSAAVNAPRTILKAYTNNKPEMGTPNQGQYVIIELDPDDFNAQSFYSFVQHTLIRQMVPYNENMIYNVDLLYDLNAVTPNISKEKPGIEPLLISKDSTFNNTLSKTLVADDFVSDVFELPENSVKKAIGYKFYTPENLDSDKKIPLVVFLHGRGQTHDYENLGEDFLADVGSPLYHNEGGVTWVKRAKEECFVVVPQNPDWLQLDDPINHAPGWMGGEVTKLIIGLVDQLIEENPQIDESRLYLTGLSLGAMGSWPIITNPDPAVSEKFAAAAIISGSATMGSLEDMKKFSNYGYTTIPLWIFHADADPVVNRLGDRFSFCQLTDEADLDEETELVVPEPGIVSVDNEYLTTYKTTNINNPSVELLYTEYKFGDGTNFLDMGMKTRNGHFVWEISYKDQEMIDWLFSHTK